MDFYNIQEIQKVLQKDMLPTGAKIDLTKFNIPVSSFGGDFSQQACLYDAKKFTILGVNQKVLDFFGLESQYELENQDIFYVEKKKRQQNPNAVIEFAYKAENELVNILSLGKPQVFPPCNTSINNDGYCTLNLTIRTPVFEGNKAVGVLAIKSDITKYEQSDVLYERYKEIYANDIKTGNRLFMKYLGLPIYDHALTTREIETLIALAKNRTNVGAARELDLSAGTLAAYVHEIKNRLHNQNLTNILLHFTMSDKRKF